MKQEFTQECECEKVIIGFSEHHAKQNLELHRLSKEHELRMKSLNNEKIITINLNSDQIAELLSINPLIIGDIKEIGRSMNQEERNAEKKKIMVS